MSSACSSSFILFKREFFNASYLAYSSSFNFAFSSAIYFFFAANSSFFFSFSASQFAFNLATLSLSA
jgi:hypothetical protein